jgi:hypothetical protein
VTKPTLASCRQRISETHLLKVVATHSRALLLDASCKRPYQPREALIERYSAGYEMAAAGSKDHGCILCTTDGSWHQ